MLTCFFRLLTWLVHLHSGKQLFQQGIVVFSTHNHSYNTAIIITDLLSFHHVLDSKVCFDHHFWPVVQDLPIGQWATMWQQLGTNVSHNVSGSCRILMYFLIVGLTHTIVVYDKLYILVGWAACVASVMWQVEAWHGHNWGVLHLIQFVCCSTKLTTIPFERSKRMRICTWETGHGNYGQRSIGIWFCQISMCVWFHQITED